MLAGFSAQVLAAEPEHVQARLFSPVTASGSETTVPVAIELRMDPGWKTYWRTPGDAGLPPVFDWTGSQNLRKADVRWPAPRRFTILDMDNFGYENHVIFPLSIQVEKEGIAVSLNLKLDILACNRICVPETKQLSFDLPAGEALPSADAKLYAAAQEKLVRENVPGMHLRKAYLAFDQNNINYMVIEGSFQKMPLKGADLFVENKPGLVFGKPGISYNKTNNQVLFRAPVHSSASFEKIAQKLEDKDVILTYTDGNLAFQEKLTLSGKGGRQLPAMQENKNINWGSLAILFTALVGGIILNLMPCVLPVLSLKVLSIIGHGGKDSRHSILKSFFAAALGILVSFWAMAAVVAVFKAGGAVVGWGIQFQHPAFLVFLLAVVLLFAANLWGFFEIPLPRFIAKNLSARHEHAPTLFGHFLTGALATLLATPCTAPFLGTAVGFAFAGTVLDIFMIFTFIGLGLAMPYIVLAAFPGFFKYLPKPGSWMVTFKKFLAAALLLTAAWLLNVLISITQTPTLDEGWQQFDEGLIAPAVSDGKTVIVDVTADWCLTCKANKRLVLEDDEIIDLLSAENIVLFQADWTQKDQSVSLYLKKFNRYGIPFNAVYGPNAPDGIVLPELLTKDSIRRAVLEASGE